MSFAREICQESVRVWFVIVVEMRECRKQCRVEDSRSFDHDSVVFIKRRSFGDKTVSYKWNNLSRDMYFLKKLLNLKGDDGFKMNEVLVSLWYIMGLWPLVYSMILLPTGRSSKSNIPVWPFLILSCFGGAYALLPYFVLWNPPPPPVEETELSRWPLNFLESKLTAGQLHCIYQISLAAGLGLIIYAALAGGDVWQEFYQYFRESKFIHVTSIDFTLLSTFAPFWVYNDTTARKWYDKGSWLLPVSVVPLPGP
ncbi:hypothetical protein QYF36_000734 [Acer negundo]|nr:hypothetical protein QYF36_000734 [Acer negundo]